MAVRKVTKKYYFSVEGETEEWYLHWLKDLINSNDNAKCKITIDCKVQKDPLKRAKSLVVTNEVQIYHLSDYESDEEYHVKEFKETMDRMKMAQTLGKKLKYHFAYSNLTFDLWIILHKIDCNGSHIHRSKYVSDINKAFGKSYSKMDEYKQEANFKSCLKQLSIEDVNMAIKRAKAIMNRNEENGYVLHRYKGFQYYEENPSLAVWEVAYKMLEDAGLYV